MVDRIPSWKAELLNDAGRATLTRSTLSSIPVHVSICCTLSTRAIEAIDKARRGFLWAGKKKVTGGKCKLAWPIACSPRDLGGLGLPDLCILGYALRLRWEWKRRAFSDAPWASLPAPIERSVSAMFEASTTFIVGNGSRTRFWTDLWLPEGRHCHFAPVVFQTVPRRWRRRTVRDALQDNQWAWDAVAATTVPFMTQFLRIWTILENVQLRPDEEDKMIWRWTPNASYSSASAYRAFFIGRCTVRGAKELWSVSCPPKVKFFFWIALHGRLWTVERRKRHGLQDDDDCSLCKQVPEHADHLLCSCVFTREIWHRILLKVELHLPSPTQDDTLLDWWLRTRTLLTDPMRRAFDSLTFLVSWMIWKERNRRTFDGVSSTTTMVIGLILGEANEWLAAGFRGLATLLALG